MAKPRICISTGTRADYGLLYWLMHDLKADNEIDLQIIASAMHLSPAFGETIAFIRKDGFHIDAEVACLDQDDSDLGMGRAYTRAVDGFLSALDRLNPDILVVLGDRFETLAIATAATFLRIPIAHIHGGEMTLGAMDDTFRHAITKMSHLHFTAAEAYAQRVRQMGEAPEHVFNVGAVGLDNFNRLSLPSKEELAADLGIQLMGDYALVTYHPATMETASPLAGLETLIMALESFPDLSFLITKANSDPGGRAINARLEGFQSSQPGRVHLVASLGQVRYLAAMKHAAMVLGNSSSGIIEAPAINVPTVNVGPRQLGRLKAESVIDVAEDIGPIKEAIEWALGYRFLRDAFTGNPPYGRPGNATGTILAILRKTRFDNLGRKPFYDLPVNGH